MAARCPKEALSIMKNVFKVVGMLSLAAAISASPALAHNRRSNNNCDPQHVPEPGSLMLLVSGVGAVLGSRKLLVRGK